MMFWSMTGTGNKSEWVPHINGTRSHDSNKPALTASKHRRVKSCDGILDARKRNVNLDNNNKRELMSWDKLDILAGSHFDYMSDDQGNPRLLGYGSYGDVYLARGRKSKELVAMKMFRKKDTSMKTVFREAAYSCVLSKNESAPKFYGLVKVNASKYYQPLALATEFIGCKKDSPCDLTRLMTTPYTGNTESGFEDSLTSHQWIRLLLQLAKEIHKCHKANIVLIDLKEDNILVRDPESNATPLLADFGLAVHNCRTIPNFGRGQLDKPESFWDFPHYAPELSDTYEVSPAADIYSFGCILARVGGVVLGGRVPSLNYLAAECTARDPTERPDGIEVIERLKNLDKVFERRASNENLIFV